MSLKKERKLPQLTRSLSFAPATINEEARTVDVTWGSDAPVLMGYWDQFYEILDFSEDAVDLSRLNAGAPLLYMHGSRDQIGVVEKAWTDGSTGHATIRFSKNPQADEIFQDVKDGIRRNMSVGYRVSEYQQILTSDTKLDTLKATKWTPSELSVVTVPADHTVGIRSEGVEEFNVRVLPIKDKMETEEEKRAREAAEKVQREADDKKRSEDAAAAERVRKSSETVNTEEVRAAAVKAERQRAADIKAAVRAAKLEDSFADELIDGGISIDAARTQIIAKFAEADPNTGRSNVRVTGKDAADKKREGLEAAIIMRAMPNAVKDKLVNEEDVAHASEFRFDSLLDMAKASLQRAGINTQGMDKMTLVRTAFTTSTSDFPVALEGVNRRILLASYNAAPDQWRQFCRIGTVSDFREYKRLRMGSLTNLDKVLENAEFKNKKITDAEFERISIATKGNTINISRQMIINDDLGAFTDLADKLGRAAARTIESDVFALFALNGGNGPTLSDGKALFHVDHGNIATTAAAPTVASFDAVRTQMKSIKDKDNNDYLDIMPAIWLGPTTIGSTARTVNDAQYDVDVSNKFQVPNKSKGIFSVMLDTPRLTGTPWYALANPAQEPVFEVAFLDGVQTPYMESQQGFTTDGIQWKVRHDFGTGAIGYRGIIKNAGAA